MATVTATATRTDRPVPERVPSDHESIKTIRGTLERVGRTNRPKVVVPADTTDAFPVDDIVRVVIDERTCHTLVETDFDGQPELRAAFDTPTLVRAPDDGTNRLTEWIEAHDVSVGASVLVDVVTEGFMYGLRTPGERTVYEAADPPSDSLSSIADDLD